MKPRPELFLCYAKEDRDLARDLYERLCAADLRVWFDEDALLPGQNWESEVRAAIRGCRLFLACLSPRSVSKKGFINRELREAIRTWEEYPSGAIYLVPILLEQCNPPEQLEGVQWCDLTDDNGFDLLLRTIHKVLRGDEGSNLRQRAWALHNSYLVRVRVTEHATNQPFEGAEVELNEIESKRGIHKLVLVKESVLRPSKLSLTGVTDPGGLVYFGLPEDQLVVGNVAWVVSAATRGHTPAHRALEYPRMKLIKSAMIIMEPGGFVFSDEEVAGLAVDESVDIALRAR